MGRKSVSFLSVEVGDEYRVRRKFEIPPETVKIESIGPSDHPFYDRDTTWVVRLRVLDEFAVPVMTFAIYLDRRADEDRAALEGRAREHLAALFGFRSGSLVPAGRNAQPPDWVAALL